MRKNIKGKDKSEQWNPTDPRHFEGKSIRELQDKLKNSEEFLKEHPEFTYGWYNEYRQELKKRIAEMIGANKS